MRLGLALLLAASLQAAHARSSGNPYPDLLVVDGTTSVLAYDPSPLQAALDADAALRGRMDKHGRGKDKEPASFRCDLRGYRATWEVRGDALYLVSLELGCDDLREVALPLLFPGQAGPVRASWYTGQLRQRKKWGWSIHHVTAGTVTGSSSIELGAPDAPYLPRILSFTLRPLDTPSCEVSLERDTLVLSRYQIGAADTTRTTQRVVPSEQQWRTFRRAVNEHDMWRWRGPYNAGHTNLTSWGVSLEYMDSPELDIGGNGAFPAGFVRFRLALQELLGGLPCPEHVLAR